MQFKSIGAVFALLPAFLFGFNCPPVAGDAGVAYDFFRSIPEGDWEGNTGIYVGFNAGAATPCQGIDFQLGSSYGIYDWAGRLSAPTHKVQQQVFVTTGFSRRTPCASGFNAGLVFDWMWNSGLGVFASNADFGQLRLQAGYQVAQYNEFGLWGTLDLYRAHTRSGAISLTYRGLSQINAYWKHLFQNSAETIVWAGVPYKSSLSSGTGRAGIVTLGAAFRAPLCGRFSVEGRGSYMAPHSPTSGLNSRYYAANVCIELKYAFGDQCAPSAPYMPLANNSNFLTDTNVTF